MEHIPILKLDDFLLVSIQVDRQDQLAMTLQDEPITRIVQDHVRGVMIDISSLEILASVIGRRLGKSALMAGRVVRTRTTCVSRDNLREQW